MKKTASLLRLPLWFLEIFTEAKSFEANPVIGSRLLNRLGLHLIRVVLAHSLTGVRRFILGWGLPAHLKRQFRRNGFIIIENALPQTDFLALQREANGAWPEVRYFVQGDTTTEFVFLDSARQQSLPACKKLAKNDSLNRVMKYVAACGLTPWMDFLRVVNTGGARQDDPQKYFHSDTFHPTMKAWLFLEDVDSSKGPFEYVQGSNRPTWKRLKWEYRQSLGVKDKGAAYARRGSLRVEESELDALGYGPIRSMEVKANTLVVADTFGFHRRGEAAANTSRLSMAFSNRINPFLLFPVPGWKWLDRLAEKQVNKHHEATTKCRSQD
ncbi:MAG: phytanoyl-CoA dioxygenase family protein [Pseudomonadales bacterium]